MNKKRALNWVLYTTVFMIMASAAYAAGEIVQSANRLNYWDVPLNHSVSIRNDGTASTNVTIDIPSGWTWVSGAGTCTNINSTFIQCILSGGGSGSYTVQSPGSSAAEYQVDKFIVNTNNSYTGNNVSMLNIDCSEIFHTLVEYGRGRGNYFYNSNSGRAGSGQTGTGCAYLPNGTFVELNFLHKTYNIKQYFSVVADAYNASYTCTYPNDTVVRQHLDTSITRGATQWDVDYFIDEISGSWERFGYLGMQFDAGDYAVGQNITINCTSINYTLPAAGGKIKCSEDSFILQFRNREPFTATASTAATIGNGTQEVIITYTITNNEMYDVSDAVIEIQAPQYATFIGTRGELWGYGLDQYRIEKAELVSGASETVVLVARFNTSTAPSITALNLSQGIKVKYTTCWEANAYNPTEYIQDITITDTATVNMAQATRIVSIIDLINNVYNMTLSINKTTFQINTTVNEVLNLARAINSTVYNINLTVTAINNTVTSIYADTQAIIDLLNCNGTADSPICGNLTAILNLVTQINTTVTTIETIVTQINATVTSINTTVTAINQTVTAIQNNVSIILNNTEILKDYLNCTNLSAQYTDSVCNRLDRIENYSISILNNLTYIWGNYTAQDIIDAIGNITVNVNLTQEDLDRILTEIQRLREFDEELVFLVTDSFNANAKARESIASGDVSAAAEQLLEARSKLDQATARLAMLREEALIEQESAEKSYWWMWLLLTALIAVVTIYMFQRVPEEPPKSKYEF